MSSEYEMKAGRVVLRQKPVATRGLNHNCNHRLKKVFISAASAGNRYEPYRAYLAALKENGM